MLSVWSGGEVEAQFQEAHEQRFGFSLKKDNIELVTARVWAYQDAPELEPMAIKQGSPAKPTDFTTLTDMKKPVPVYLRHQLVSGQALSSPCIVVDDSGTIYVQPGWQANVTKQGHINLQMPADCQ